MDTTLRAERVEELFMYCLSGTDDDPSECVTINGIVTTVKFNTTRLRVSKCEIEALLEQLPEDFQRSKGGGMSFLKACVDKHGNQWVDFHLTMEKLFQLGIAIGKVKSAFPRELWSALPGGMPYYVVN